LSSNRESAQFSFPHFNFMFFPLMRSSIILALLMLLAAVVGYHLVRLTTFPTKASKFDQEKPSSPIAGRLAENKPLRRAAPYAREHSLRQAAPPFALANERIARFQNEDDYRKFLASLEERDFSLLGKSDRLLAVRFGYADGFDPDELEKAELGYNYLVTIPTPPDAQAQPSAMGFGQHALAWLGIEADNSTWGKGITVAVLDSGVNNHPALDAGNGKVTHAPLTELAQGDTQLGHGTAVASIISGDDSLIPGVAPASDILSIRITDAEGSSDSFTLANGIMTAADAGAKVINISMGSYGDSRLVYDAVQYAHQQGAVIVASSGNAGLDSIAYPAAYDGVIAVGAVEAQGEHLDFSNAGESLDIVAPGYQVNAAWGENQLTSFSGTSASAPFVSGAIAAIMSEQPQLTAQQAADLVLKLGNDAGYPGTDTAYGSGILAIDRVIEHGSPGIYDAAVTSQFLVPAANNTSLPKVLVTIQNQGTETLINSPVTITTPSGSQSINISSLAAGEIQSFPVPVRLPEDGSPVAVSTSVETMEPDQEPANNSRDDRFSRELIKASR